MSVDLDSVAATFVSEYYTLYCSQPHELARLYTDNVYVCHGDARSDRATGSKEASALLSNIYPSSNHGKISVREVELPATSGTDVALSIRVRGRFTPTAGDKAIKDFTQRFEIIEHPYPDPQTGLSVYGVKSDIISWTPVVEANNSAKAAPGTVIQPSKPPAVHSDWATETPPLFAQTAPATEISPLDKPMAAAAAPPVAPLPDAATVEAGAEKHVDPTPAAEQKKRTAADIVAGKKTSQPGQQEKAAATKKEETPSEPAEKKEAEQPAEQVAPEPEAPKQEAPKAEEPDFSKMSMVERLRYKQNIPPQEKKPAPEKKEEAPKKEGGDRRRGEKKEGEKKEGGRRDGSKKEGGDRKKDSGEKKSSSAGGEKKGEKKEAGKKEGGERTTTTSSTTAGGSGDNKKLAKDVVYYDLILKGLPKGTKAEQIDVLLEPYLSYVKPIKLEAQPDKHEPSTIRTFAFIKLDGKGGKFNSADEAVPGLKGKLKIGSTNVMVDRVREKFEK